MSPVRNCASRGSEKDISNGVRDRFGFVNIQQTRVIASEVPRFARDKLRNLVLDCHVAIAPRNDMLSEYLLGFFQKLRPLFRTLLIVFIICCASFSFAAEGKPRKYRPHLVGNCETGERFAPSLENLFLPDDEVDDNYSFDEWSLKYIYPLNKTASVNLKHRMVWKDYADKESFDSTANYYTIGLNQRLNPLLNLRLEIQLQDRDYVNDFHKNYRTMGGSAQLRIKPAAGISSYELGCGLREREYLESGERDFNITSFFLRWKAEILEDFILKAKYKAKYRHYEVDSTPQKDRFKHSVGLGFELWF